MTFITVKTGGTHREMGVDFGRAAKDILRELLAESARFYKKHAKHDAEFARRYAMRNFLPHVRRRYPKYLEETRGIAEGANLTFEEVFFLTADEELSALWEKKILEKCSSVAVRTTHGILLGHNEDYPPRYYGRLVIVEAEPNDAPAFLALTYPYILAGPSCGMNAEGLSFAADSLAFPTQKNGIPSNYVLRDLFRAKRFSDVRRCMSTQALMGNAVIVVSAEGAMIVEASPLQTAEISLRDEKFLAHTNHSLAKILDRQKEKPTMNSKRRLRVLTQTFVGNEIDVSLLKRTLSSTKNGLCRPARRAADSCTIASVILDPKRKVMYVAKRGPDGHGFQPYYMNTYVRHQRPSASNDFVFRARKTSH